MSVDKEKKNKKKHSDEPLQEEQKSAEFDEASLTPWQKENLHYLETKGSEPPWKLALVEETADPKDVEPEKTELPDKKKKNRKQKNKADKTANDHTEDGTEHIQTHKSFADRLPNIKSQRHKVLQRRMILLLTLFSIPLIFFIYYVSPYSKLQKITVNGNSKVSSEDIIQSSTLKSGEDIWKQFFTRSTAEKAIAKNLDQIKSVKISFSSPTSLKVSVSEYKELAFLRKDNQYYPILENGAVLKEASSDAKSDYPIFEDFKNQTIIRKTIKAYNQLTSDITSLITQIKYTPNKSNNELLTLSMSDGNQVLVPYSTMDSQMKYYKQVASQMDKKGVVDMEVGIFSYPYGNDSKDANENSTENSSENNE